MKSVMEFDPWLAAPLIKEFEGYSARSYLCPAGIWTIGYGHTRGVKPSQIITREKADELLRQDLINTQDELSIVCKVPVSEGMFIALMSFVFNLGLSKVRNSTLFKKLNAGDYQGAAQEFSRWKYADGKVLPGLERRRAAEQKAFLGQ